MNDAEPQPPVKGEQQILCVDDDHEFLNSLQFFLPEKINQDAGHAWYRVLFIDSPTEAINTLTELTASGETVAMVISDQKMPDMGGIDLLAHTKKISPESIRVLLTGNAGLESAIIAINNQILDKYLTKPIEDEHDFVISIQHLLRNFQMKGTIEHQNKIIRHLYEFSNVLNATADLQSTLDYIVAFTHEHLKADQVSLMLVEDGALRIKAAKGLPAEAIPSFRIPITERALQDVFRSRRLGFAATHRDIPYLDPSQEHGVVETPLLYGGLASAGRTIAVITVGRKIGHTPLGEPDLRDLSRIVDTASIAVQNRLNHLRLQQAYLETKRQADELEYKATHDTLTNLPNRTLLHHHLQQAILVGRREHTSVAVLLMDLNRFKEVNDTLSHQTGDLLLQQVGPRVRGVLRESDTIARLGGDEFAMLLPGVGTASATLVAHKILAALGQPFFVEGLPLDIGVGIGIAVFPDHGEDADALIRRADVAMYVAKQAGNECFVYASDHDHYSPHRLALMGELRQAIGKSQILLHYQPKVDFRTGRVTGVEGLVRWRHPTRGLIPPDQFIPLAEQTGLIKPLTLEVLDSALRQGRTWHQGGLALSVAINLSARTLHDPELPHQVATIIQDAGAAPCWLELEITESMIMADTARAMEILSRLDAMGVRLSIDDFGTGYSSLAYIKKLPVQTIKIDKSFVLSMVRNHDDAVIVRSTIELAHMLGLTVVAEGVEDRETWDALLALGCDTGQGYYISPPLAADELTAWLNESPWSSDRVSGAAGLPASQDQPRP